MNYNEEENLNEEVTDTPTETSSTEIEEPLSIETDDESWIDSLTETTLEEEENLVIKPQRNYVNEFIGTMKNTSTRLLTNCRKDNRSILTGFLVVAAMSCMLTISVIKLTNKTNDYIEVPVQEQYPFQAGTRPSRDFDRGTNSTTNQPSNNQSSSDLSESQIEEILKYYFQYQQGSSSSDNAF